MTSTLRRRISSPVFFAILLVGGAVAVRGQSALDDFNPNANGAVHVVVVQPDGKILIGGSFTSLAPNGGVSVTRNHIARLNPDGTLDTTFNPNANNEVWSIAVQADGEVLVGGVFTIVGGQARTNIARLDATTGLADSFAPNANNEVDAIAVQADGKILAGGVFTSIGGQTRNHVARLDPSTGLADSFDPNANGNVQAITIQADGKILAGGFFNGANSIGGQTRNRIARLDPATGAADSFDPNASGFVLSIAVQVDGKILVGGAFNGANSIGGQARDRLARLDPVTGLADSFDPAANNYVWAIVPQVDGKVLISGDFTSLAPGGGPSTNRNYIARLSPNGTLDTVFDPKANNEVRSIALQSNGKILAGGNFTALSPNGGVTVPRNDIARLETDGRVDQTLTNTSINGIAGNVYVYATVVQADGKILIGGQFTNVLGVARTNIARLNTDGTLDTDFNPNANFEVDAIALQADGKILVGGVFNGIGGQTRNHIARLDPVTGLADSFNPNANSGVDTITLQADGKILVGGAFNGANSIGGQARNYITRLDPVTGLADSFDPKANNYVLSIAVQVDGKILVGGYFSGTNSIGGQARNYIARLDATTGLADAFNPNANDIVRPIAVQADGKILVGGFFTGTNSIGGQTRNRIARLDPVTGLADSFDPNANGSVLSIAAQADGKILVGGTFNGANSIGGQARNRIARLDPATGLADSFDPNASGGVFSLAVRADGKILAGGTFTTIGGQTRDNFARLSNDTVAQQDLSVSQTSVTWTCSGSSPQFNRVTFEDSADGVNYNFLGYGTAAGSNWTLTGLNQSVEQNLFIRARGSYRSGINNGSECIQESVRNVFLSLIAATPPVLNIQRSAGTDVVLSWATNFTGFTLEANTNITTTNWSSILPAPSVSGTNNVVTNAVNGSALFYRLRK